MITFGARIGLGGNGIPDTRFHRLAARFAHAQLVTLVAFGALMVATNVVNNALEVDLDPELLPYRAAVSATPWAPRPNWRPWRRRSPVSDGRC